MTDIARRFAELRSAVANGTYVGPLTKAEPMSHEIRIPSTAELNEVTEYVAGAGVEFSQLSPDNRATVLKIAIQADISHTLAQMLSDTGHMANWFQKSRLFEG